MNTEKKYKGSVWATICYVLAALMLIYTCYQAGNTVKTINDYYAQYQMTAKPMEYVTYILQSTLEPLMHTVVLFMLGYIVNEVRKCNPANYISEAEKADAKDEKRAARDAKQAAKGDAAAARKASKIAAETKKTEAAADTAVVANFADETKADKPKQVRKSGGNRNNNSVSNKPKKSGEGRKEGEAGKNGNAGKGNKDNKDNRDNKDNKDSKDSKDNKDRKPAGGNNGNRKNNSGSGSKSGKPADARNNQKPKAKKPAANDEDVEIPWEVNADFTAEVHEE